MIQENSSAASSVFSRHRQAFAVLTGALQVLIVILFGIFTEYAPSDDGIDSVVDHYYPFFADVHVMIFIGFGMLMTFLKRYGFSSVGYNLLLATVVIQWALLNNGFWHQAIPPAGGSEVHWHKLQLGVTDLITADFAAGAVLISFGAVLGKANPAQLVVMAVMEVVFFALNEAVGAGHLQAVDMGGSIFVHLFGAVFGLAVSQVLYRPQYKPAGLHPKGKVVAHRLNGSNRNSDMTAMVGTLALLVFWPSFNGALALQDQQYRVVVNTVLALSGSTVATFVTDCMLRPHNKFDMVSIQNGVIAGGVAVGSSSDLVIQPVGAVAVGVVAGVVSVLGYVYLSPWLERTTGTTDTCGVLNLHGVPGVIGALGGAVSASIAGDSAYGSSIGRVFPARAPSDPTLAAALGVDPGDDRTASGQAIIQVYAMLITLGIAVAGGIITAMVMKLPALLAPSMQRGKWLSWGASSPATQWYDDALYWEVPESEDEEDEEAQEDAAKATYDAISVEIARLEEARKQLHLGKSAEQASPLVEEPRAAITAEAAAPAAAAASLQETAAV